jgi:hypothetical protein
MSFIYLEDIAMDNVQNCDIIHRNVFYLFI